MLNDGKIIIDGTPDEIKNSMNEIVRRFVLGEADERELAALK
jgi:ABC-type transporter Mla maintaining outer membrane lipid asymmetry ATPase subunit MlaF